jgi:hypothetical protein
MSNHFINSNKDLNENNIKNGFILDVEDLYVRIILIGKMIICEIPESNNWESCIEQINANVYLYTGCKEWMELSDKTAYHVEIKGINRKVWVGRVCSYNDVTTQISIMKSHEGSTDSIKKVRTMYGRCKRSMMLLDDIHREHVINKKFKKNEVIAIKSVAGSGKTTTLLNLAKKHKDKRILYIAFNKSLITEIKEKLKSQNIRNMIPKTFDALLYNLYTSINGNEPHISDLRPHMLGDINTWFIGKPYKLKDYYCKIFSKYCNDHIHNDIVDFCMKNYDKKQPLLEGIWDKVNKGSLITFESIRKQAYINHWFRKSIDKEYDMIMIDETQDFDMMMLNMLLNDTTIPKVFVGDPKQSIYQFRGCINAFDYLPKDALTIEFYSTFRVGNPACDIIRSKFDNCWMISKCKNDTHFVDSFDLNEGYTYLFRSWRVLLETATRTNDIWIYNYEKKMNEIRNLHKKLQNVKKIDESNNTCEDDLPMFIKSLSLEDLEKLIDNVTNNLSTFEESKIKMYTVHSYKGMEDINIRIANDVDKDKDENIYYVAITRGMQKILIDPFINKVTFNSSSKKETIIEDYTTECGHCVNATIVNSKKGKLYKINISGPYIFESSGFKTLYSSPNIDSVHINVGKYLNNTGFV